ncbi:hypothetical protein HPB51_020342 [Rhipicephalus microplus]|uniref:Uncharacterized protein n=1 Tax=Rhipicephalus microplus TaxID=6941 RepID=A0A9J6DWG5_RHIMP|nr:hypothetical protein HPB51_020342 [Rhipicephalus microplus]
MEGCQEPSLTSLAYRLSPSQRPPYQEPAWLRQCVKRRQEYSKAYTDKRQVAEPIIVVVGDAKKPSISFEGVISFSEPRKVVDQCGPASFILDDGNTWNAANLCKVPIRRPGDNGRQQHMQGVHRHSIMTPWIPLIP